MALGIVEGLTEYLPVSSTGHLILTQRLLDIPAGQAADAYAICIQAGAILAVLGLYWTPVKRMARGILGRDRQGLTLAINIIVAFLPAAVIGLLFDAAIEEHLFGLVPITVAWLVGGLAILAVPRWRRPRRPEEDGGRELMTLTWRMALLIGFAQCLAMWPGTSRSLVTILAGTLVGLSLRSAVEFSFLLGLVTLTAATAYKAVDGGAAMLQAYGWTTMGIGFFFATLSAALAVKWMVAYLNRHSLMIFGIYRVALGLGVGVALWAGILMP
jgi:undecaprenyl-diphosphatase